MIKSIAIVASRHRQMRSGLKACDQQLQQSSPNEEASLSNVINCHVYMLGYGLKVLKPVTRASSLQ